MGPVLSSSSCKLLRVPWQDGQLYPRPSLTEQQTDRQTDRRARLSSLDFPFSSCPRPDLFESFLIQIRGAGKSFLSPRELRRDHHESIPPNQKSILCMFSFATGYSQYRSQCEDKDRRHEIVKEGRGEMMATSKCCDMKKGTKSNQA